MQRDNIYYTNCVHIGATPFDFYIDCYNLLSNEADIEGEKQHPELTLLMSPQHFIKMYEVMGGLIDKYQTEIKSSNE